MRADPPELFLFIPRLQVRISQSLQAVSFRNTGTFPARKVGISRRDWVGDRRPSCP